MIEIWYFKRCEMWNYHQVYHEVPKELLVISKHAGGVAVTFVWCKPRTCPWACQICQSPEGRCPVPVEAPGWGWAFHVVHHMGSGRCNMVVDVAADRAFKIRRA